MKDIICKSLADTRGRIMVPTLLCYHGWKLSLGTADTTSTKTASWIDIVLAN